MAEGKSLEQVDVTVPEGSTERRVLAGMRVDPFLRHGAVGNAMAATVVKCDGFTANAVDVGDAMQDVAKRIGSGDAQPITDLLLAQSVMLDVTTTEMIRRAWANVGEYPDAFRSYMGLALKAQAQSRATLEALARIHQPREQVVRHVHVYEGGQAVVAEQLHMHGPGVTNDGTLDQSHATGTGGAGERAALPSPNPFGNGVPIASGAGPEALPDARRHKPRRAPRERQRAKARATDGGDAPGA